MNLLLDTHILLWSLSEPGRLSSGHKQALVSPENQVWVSSISVWEISIKTQIGKLKVPDEFLDSINEQGFRQLPFSFEHGLEVQKLPLLHRDPFDRGLMAQAKADNLTLVTADPQIRQYANFLNILSP